MIKEILDSDKQEKKSSGKFSISSIGCCWRKKYLELKGLYKQEFTPQTLRIFEIGNLFHERIVKELVEKANTDLHLVAAEVNIPEQKYISGRIDIILSNNNELYIVDVKSAGDYTLGEIKQGKINENYINQVNLYMHFIGIYKGLLLFVGKNKGEIEEVEVIYNKEKCEKLIKEIEDFFINNVKKNIEPKKCDGGKWGCDCCK